MEPFKLGPYDIRERLGQGGMGAVYRGWDTANNTMRAVKVLPTAMASKAGFQARFGIEIETLRKLDHPNIIRFFGWGQEEDGTLFYGMELVEGVTIEDELDRGRRFTFRQVIDITQQLARALKHAHDRGVVHRDIKPANVMLTDDGTVKLADFGIARLYGVTGLTHDGGPIGTASYMSPEQTDGGKITERSDLYSLGCLMFALLTGRPPFVADSVSQLMKLHRTQEPIPVRQFNPKIPAALEAVITGLLAKDPADRIPTTAALLRSLQMVVESAPGEMANDTPTAPTPDDRIYLAPPSKSPEGKKKPGTVVRPLSEMTSPGTPPPRPMMPPLPKDGEKTAVGMGPKTDIPDEQTDADSTGRPDTLLPRGNTVEGGDETQVTNAPGGATQMIDNADQTIATSLVRDGGSMATQVSSASPRKTGAAAPVADPMISHFTTAEDAARIDLESRQAARIAEAREARKGNIVSYAVLGALLLAVTAVGYWFTRPPTLEQRVTQLEILAEAEGADALLDAETNLRDFARLYPDHPQAEAVNAYLVEIDLMRLERRLDVRARYARGLKSQGPLERAYMEAIKYAEIEPEVGQRKLQAILALFDNGTSPKNEDTEQLLTLTRRRLEQVTEAINEQTTMEKSLIRTRVEWAEANATSDPAGAHATCQSIVVLYGEKTWASEYIARAHTLLASLPAPASASTAGSAGNP